MPGPDPSHWLHRFTAREWIRASLGELDAAHRRQAHALAQRERRGRVGEVVAEELEAELVVALHARVSALHGGIVGLGSVAVAVRRSASFRHWGVFRERGAGEEGRGV